MKIACISASKVPAAVANSIQTMKVCQALAQLGHEIRLIIPQVRRDSALPPPEEIAHAYGLQVSFPIQLCPSRPRLRRYDFCWQAVQKARKMKADLIYTWALQAALFASWANLPVILEMHGPPEGRFGPLLFRLFLRRPGPKRLLPITQALAAALQTRIPQNQKQPPTTIPPLIVVSPNGIDLERYQNLPDPQTARAALGLAETPTAAYTGHLYPGRGMDLLLALARRFPRTQFLWVGGHPQDVTAWRQRLVAERLENILLTGFIENRLLPVYQAAADVLLMPYERAISGSSGGNSAEYCSPMKMFEYMACGRAILSSDLPVIREVLNESNALLCPPEDPDSWERALASLLTHPEQRAALGRQARLDVQAYTWLGRAQKALAGFNQATVP